MAYEKINFVNDTTELSAENFNHMESGIENADKKVSVGASSNNSELWVSTSNNLFNKNNVEENKGISSSNGITYDTSGYTVSEYIYLKKGKYIGTGFNRYASYDTNKTFIKSELATSFELTTDGYVRLQLQSANLDTTQLNEGTTLLPYKPYGLTGIQINNNGTYEKYTDTLSVGSESNNAGLWVSTSRNLFDSFSLNSTYFDVNADGTIKLKQAGESTIQNPIVLKANTTYVITCNLVSGTAPSDNYPLYFRNTFSFVKGNGTPATYTPTSDTTISSVIVNSNYSGIGNTLAVQIEEGSTPTKYEAYGNKEIKANINGTYETIVNKNVYSTSEVVIGEWLGKPLYRKVIVGTATSEMQSSSQVIGRIENASIKRLESCFSVIGSTGSVSGQTRFADDDQVWCYVAFGGDVKAKIQGGSYVGREINVVIEYTKIN